MSSVSASAGILGSLEPGIGRPGILAGWALVFLLIMEELPATLILCPIGFNTLAISIWSNASEAFFARRLCLRYY